MNGIESIAAERRRQIEVEGWTPEHDDEHDSGEMAAAASCYSIAAFYKPYERFPVFWPWGKSWWKPKDRRSNLVRAGALIAAEIDRLDRMAAILGPEAQPYIGQGSGETFDRTATDTLLAEAAADDSPMATDEEKATLRAEFLGPNAQDNEQEGK